MNVLLLAGRGKPRQLARPVTVLVNLIGVALCALLFSMALGYYVDKMTALFLFLGGMLSLAFLTVTGGPSRPQHLTPGAVVLVILSVLSSAYFVAMRDVHASRMPMIDPLTTLDKLAALTLILLVLEATRRCIGLVLVTLVLGFLAYALWGDQLGGTFSHRHLQGAEILDQLVFTPDGLMGSSLEVAALLVFVFVVFGALLEQWGGGDFFHDLARALFGKRVGGPAKVAVFSSGLYGSISGSPTADVVTTGSFTIPLMVRSGLKPGYAAGVEAAASTGGALLPPVMGSAAFLMTDFTGIPYSTIVLAAIVPALFYYFSLFTAVHLRAQRDQTVVVDDGNTLTVAGVLKRDWYFLIPIALLVWGVLSLNRPVFAGALACCALLPIGMLRTRAPRAFLSSLIRGMTNGMLQVTGVAIACAVAGLVIGTLSVADLTGKISSGMFVLAHGHMLLTLLVSVLVIVLLGMGMPTPAVYALAAVLTAPALLEMKVSLLAAHLFIVYFASMSAITPPVAVAAFAAASIARENPMKVAFQACRIAIVAFLFPFVFIGQPALLLEGDLTQILVTIVLTAIATLGLTAGLEGYFTQVLSWRTRAPLIALALAVLLGMGQNSSDMLIIPAAGIIVLGLALLYFGARVKPAPQSYAP